MNFPYVPSALGCLGLLLLGVAGSRPHPVASANSNASPNANANPNANATNATTGCSWWESNGATGVGGKHQARRPPRPGSVRLRVT